MAAVLPGDTSFAVISQTASESEPFDAALVEWGPAESPSHISDNALFFGFPAGPIPAFPEAREFHPTRQSQAVEGGKHGGH